MSRYPSCTWKPIIGTSTSTLTQDILCLHTCVGYLRSTWDYFNRTDVGVYSHICIGGIWGSDIGYDLDGVGWQMADTAYRAAANLNGNGRVISVETADNAALPIAAWTPKQCDRIVAIMVDAHLLDGIPLTLIPDTLPGRRGIAYHRQGIDPWRVPDGELWSSSTGKICPGDARIAQIPGLISRARAIVAGQGGLHMDADVQAAFDAIPNAVAARLFPLGTDVKTIITRVGQLLTALNAAGVEDAKRDAAVLGAITALPSGDVDEAALAADLAPRLAELGVNLDADTLVKAIRADLAAALAEPAA